MSTTGVSDPAGTPDSFQAILLDSSGIPLLPLTAGPFYAIDNDGTDFFDPTQVTVSILGSGATRVSLDVSSLASQEMTVFFLLTADPVGHHDGLTTTVSLDNVAINDSQIPEPNSIAIMLMCVAGAIRLRRSPRPRYAVAVE